MMDLTEREAAAVTRLQRGVPLVERPFQVIGETCGLSEDQVVGLTERLLANGEARRFGGIFDARRIGFRSALCCMDVPDADLARIAAEVAAVPGVTHAYERGWPEALPRDWDGGPRNERWPNLWFTLATEADRFPEELERLRMRCAPYAIAMLPAVRRFKIDVVFDVRTRDRDERVEPQTGVSLLQRDQEPPVLLTDAERDTVRLFQGHIEPAAACFDAPARKLGVPVGELLARLASWRERGVMRRLGLLLHHREAGFKANGMCCWPCGAEAVLERGRRLAACPEVTHCYERPARAGFPYTLYAMIHTGSWQETHALFQRIGQEAGLADGRLLFSLREFKKTSMTFFQPDGGGR
ncbi:MAG: hypothetical protein J6336_04355 [Kiritimatiellae bacterium]|nr:hypothetical protein [Kiritimatiellia bacterium]